MWSFSSDLSSWTQCQKHFEACNMQQNPCHPRHNSLLSQVYMQISLYIHSHISQPRRKASSWPLASKIPTTITNPLKNKTESKEQKQKIKEGKTSLGEREVSEIRFLGVLQWWMKVNHTSDDGWSNDFMKWSVLHFYFIPLLTVKYICDSYYLKAV